MLNISAQRQRSVQNDGSPRRLHKTPPGEVSPARVRNAPGLRSGQINPQQAGLTRLPYPGYDEFGRIASTAPRLVQDRNSVVPSRASRWSENPEPPGSGRSTQPVTGDTQQWETLRKRGLVLSGNAVTNEATHQAPLVSHAPSQISFVSNFSARFNGSQGSPSAQRDAPPMPRYCVHPALHTTNHPSDLPRFERPKNVFMRTPHSILASAQGPSLTQESHRKPLTGPIDGNPAPFWQPRHVAFDVSASMTRNVLSRTPEMQHGVLHSVPNRAAHMEMLNDLRAYAALPYTERRNHADVQLQPSPPAAQVPLQRLVGGYRHVSRPPAPIAAEASSNMRSSSLRRQETDASHYSQVTLPEQYTRSACPSQAQALACGKDSPLILDDWKPLCLNPSVKRRKTQRTASVEQLHCELTACLSPPAIPEIVDPMTRNVTEDQPTLASTSNAAGADDVDATIDFTRLPYLRTEDLEDFGTVEKPRPILVRRKSSQHRYTRRQELANSIVDKARGLASPYRGGDVSRLESAAPLSPLCQSFLETLQSGTTHVSVVLDASEPQGEDPKRSPKLDNSVGSVKATSDRQEIDTAEESLVAQPLLLKPGVSKPQKRPRCRIPTPTRRAGFSTFYHARRAGVAAVQTDIVVT